MYENCADNLSNFLRLNEVPLLIFFPILLQNRQKPIKNSCRSNLWYTPMLILWNLELKNCGLVTKRFGFIQIPEARMGSKTCRFQQLLKHRNTELLLLLGIISPYSVIVKIVCLEIRYSYQSTLRFLDSSSSENT